MFAGLRFDNSIFSQTQYQKHFKTLAYFLMLD